MASKREDLITALDRDLSNTVGNIKDDDLDLVQDTFTDTLNKALAGYRNGAFNNDGFVKNVSNIDLPADDAKTIHGIFNGVNKNMIGMSAVNQSELLVRRDINNICVQMPEMRDTIKLLRDSIIECNISDGRVSRTNVFTNNKNSTASLHAIEDIESKYKLLHAIKEYIVPQVLMYGEMYVHILPFSKLFAEIDATKKKNNKMFNEGVEVGIDDMQHIELSTEENTNILLESVAGFMNQSIETECIANHSPVQEMDDMIKPTLEYMLSEISVINGSNELFGEMGFEGYAEFVKKEYVTINGQDSFIKENLGDTNTRPNIFTEELLNTAEVSPEEINKHYGSYKEVNGCYVKYLDGLHVAPIRMDRRIIGYYYVCNTNNITTNQRNSGVFDISNQMYSKDRNIVDSLATIILKSFNKSMLEKNLKLKEEIADIIMAHKFGSGKMSFVFIPEDEVVRIAINEDSNGKGHSILEPSLFPAKSYTMLNMYNMLFTLNNTTTRYHYIRQSGLRKDMAASMMKQVEKMQNRRVSVDDVMSYSGVLDKIGAINEIMVPVGRDGTKPVEHDTIDSIQNPISTEYMEQQRRQAITGTGSPHLLVINAIDEVDFAKTLEMSNARHLRNVASYKINFNEGITELYKRILSASSDLDDITISSFRFQFNDAKQQELNITADMINNFNVMSELVLSLYYTKDELESEDGKPTPLKISAMKELAKQYLPQLSFDELDKTLKDIRINANSIQLDKTNSKAGLTEEDVADY